ncbi:ABC transporter substrate-binding protein [Rhodococcus sp. 27YEA15]|uniref:ABC transporter substrate-binding protein n=1 Tax=Rhodococcus sp. 27YEA15 TaxID=3156259 RepID=UPI003C7C220F
MAVIAFAATLAVAIAGCSSETTEESTNDAGSTSDGQFPVTIEHAHGSTTIEKRPERVVTVGFTDHETVLALGVTPVGVVSWFGEDVDATWPWVADKWNGATPTYVSSSSGELLYEKILTLEPDLILALYANLDDGEYSKLSAIAPTIAQSGVGAPYTTPWTDMTTTAGKALGKTPEAQTLISDINAQFAQARDKHPEFATQRAAVAVARPEVINAYSSKDSRGIFLSSLGFKPSSELDAFVGERFAETVPPERLDLLDTVDRLFMLADAEPSSRLAANPLYQNLPVVRDKRVTELADKDAPSIGAAMSYGTVLSIPYAIDKIVELS